MVVRYKVCQISRCLLFIVTVSASCKPQSFSGGGGNQPSTQVKKPQPSRDNVASEDPTCTAAKLTSLSSLTSSIDQRQPLRSVDVQLTFLPCANQKVELSYPIWFDLDANLDFGPSGNAALQYELSGVGLQASQGSFSFVMGTDLFGKAGPEYGHFESNGPMRASWSMTTAILKIKLGALKILGPSSVAAPASGPFQIPLHVKIGEAPPVTESLLFLQ
jgi:hypothetical protein